MSDADNPLELKLEEMLNSQSQVLDGHLRAFQEIADAIRRLQDDVAVAQAHPATSTVGQDIAVALQQLIKDGKTLTLGPTTSDDVRNAILEFGELQDRLGRMPQDLQTTVDDFRRRAQAAQQQQQWSITPYAP